MSLTESAPRHQDWWSYSWHQMSHLPGIETNTKFLNRDHCSKRQPMITLHSMVCPRNDSSWNTFCPCVCLSWPQASASITSWGLNILSCWPRPGKYHNEPRHPLYSRGSTTMGTWSLDALVLSHISSPRNCQLDKAMGRPFKGATEAPTRRCYSVRMGHPLQNIIYMLSQCTLYVLYGAESPQIGDTVSEGKREWHHLPSLTVRELVIPIPKLCRFRDPGAQRRKAPTSLHSKNHIKL